MKGQTQGQLDLKAPYLAKGAKLGPMLLLTINRKPYMESPMTPSLLTLSDLKGQTQGHSDFKASYFVNEPS